MNKSKTIFIQEKETVEIDTNSGEIVSSKKTIEKHKKSIEPNFVKLYLDDIALLQNLPRSHSDVLFELLKLMNYRNEIVLNSAIKEEIMESVKNVNSLQALNNILTALKKKDILFSNRTGIYIANPYLFGKGHFAEVQSIRLIIDYTPTQTVMKAEVQKGENNSIPAMIARREKITTTKDTEPLDESTKPEAPIPLG